MAPMQGVYVIKDLTPSTSISILRLSLSQSFFNPSLHKDPRVSIISCLYFCYYYYYHILPKSSFHTCSSQHNVLRSKTLIFHANAETS